MKTFTNSSTYRNIKYDCIQLIIKDPFWAGYYAYYILNRRWVDVGKPEVEDLIGTDRAESYYYAFYVLKKRWADIGKPEVEDLIGTNAKWAYLYARNVLKQRWVDVGKPEVEDLILQSEYAEEYKEYFASNKKDHWSFFVSMV